MKKQRFSRSIRLCALATLVVFLLTNTALGQGTVSVPILPQSSSEISISGPIAIPEEFGTVEEQYAAPGKAPFVVFIQDAHAIIDAQDNIRSLIHHLQQNYGFSLVALEGGKGRMDPTLFRAFPEEGAKERVIRSYVERAEVTGAEMAAILNPAEARYSGIEDWELFRANTLAYLAASKNRDAILKELDGTTARLDERRKAVYSKALNEFHERESAFKSEKSNLLDFLKYLKEFTDGGEWLSGAPHLAALFESIENDSSLAKENLEVSIRELADTLKKETGQKLGKKALMEFNGEYQDFVTGKKDCAAFLKSLVKTGEELGVPVPLTPKMRELLGHADTLSTIKGTKLFDELEALTDAIRERHIEKPEERELEAKYRAFDLLRDLARLELTRERLEIYQRDSETYLALLENRAVMDPALEFYKFALERDRALQRNLAKLIKDGGSGGAVVVLGGFHKSGFERRLKENGYSYAVVTPKIRSLRGEDRYEGVMQGELSYADMIRTTFYDAFVRHSSLKLVAELSEPEFRKTLKLWRDGVLRKLSEEGRIAEAGEYTQYIDLLAKIYVEKFGAKGLAGNNREEILARMRKEFSKLNDNLLKRVWSDFESRLENFMSGFNALAERNEVAPENVLALLSERQPGKPENLQALRALLDPNLTVKDFPLFEPAFRKAMEKNLPAIRAGGVENSAPAIILEAVSGYLESSFEPVLNGKTQEEKADITEKATAALPAVRRLFEDIESMRQGIPDEVAGKAAEPTRDFVRKTAESAQMETGFVAGLSGITDADLRGAVALEAVRQYREEIASAKSMPDLRRTGANSLGIGSAGDGIEAGKDGLQEGIGILRSAREPAQVIAGLDEIVSAMMRDPEISSDKKFGELSAVAVAAKAFGVDNVMAGDAEFALACARYALQAYQFVAEKALPADSTHLFLGGDGFFWYGVDRLSRGLQEPGRTGHFYVNRVMFMTEKEFDEQRASIREWEAEKLSEGSRTYTDLRGLVSSAIDESKAGDESDFEEKFGQKLSAYLDRGENAEFRDRLKSLVDGFAKEVGDTRDCVIYDIGDYNVQPLVLKWGLRYFSDRRLIRGGPERIGILWHTSPSNPVVRKNFPNVDPRDINLRFIEQNHVSDFDISGYPGSKPQLMPADSLDQYQFVLNLLAVAHLIRQREVAGESLSNLKSTDANSLGDGNGRNLIKGQGPLVNRQGLYGTVLRDEIEPLTAEPGQIYNAISLSPGMTKNEYLRRYAGELSRIHPDALSLVPEGDLAFYSHSVDLENLNLIPTPEERERDIRKLPRESPEQKDARKKRNIRDIFERGLMTIDQMMTALFESKDRFISSSNAEVISAYAHSESIWGGEDGITFTMFPGLFGGRIEKTSGTNSDERSVWPMFRKDFRGTAAIPAGSFAAISVREGSRGHQLLKEVISEILRDNPSAVIPPVFDQKSGGLLYSPATGEWFYAQGARASGQALSLGAEAPSESGAKVLGAKRGLPGSERVSGAGIAKSLSERAPPLTKKISAVLQVISLIGLIGALGFGIYAFFAFLPALGTTVALGKAVSAGISLLPLTSFASSFAGFLGAAGELSEKGGIFPWIKVLGKSLLIASVAATYGGLAMHVVPYLGLAASVVNIGVMVKEKGGFGSLFTSFKEKKGVMKYVELATALSTVLMLAGAAFRADQLFIHSGWKDHLSHILNNYSHISSPGDYEALRQHVPLLSNFSYDDFEGARIAQAGFMEHVRHELMSNPAIPQEIRAAFNATGEVVIVPKGVFPDGVPGTVDLVTKTVFVNQNYIETAGLHNAFGDSLRTIDVVAHEGQHLLNGVPIVRPDGSYDFNAHVRDEINVYERITLALQKIFGKEVFSEERLELVPRMVEGAKAGDPVEMQRITGQLLEEAGSLGAMDEPIETGLLTGMEAAADGVIMPLDSLQGKMRNAAEFLAGQGFAGVTIYGNTVWSNFLESKLPGDDDELAEGYDPNAPMGELDMVFSGEEEYRKFIEDKSNRSPNGDFRIGGWRVDAYGWEEDGGRTIRTFRKDIPDLHDYPGVSFKKIGLKILNGSEVQWTDPQGAIGAARRGEIRWSNPRSAPLLFNNIAWFLSVYHGLDLLKTRNGRGVSFATGEADKGLEQIRQAFDRGDKNRTPEMRSYQNDIEIMTRVKKMTEDYAYAEKTRPMNMFTQIVLKRMDQAKILLLLRKVKIEQALSFFSRDVRQGNVGLALRDLSGVFNLIVRGLPTRLRKAVFDDFDLETSRGVIFYDLFRSITPDRVMMQFHKSTYEPPFDPWQIGFRLRKTLLRSSDPEAVLRSVERLGGGWLLEGFGLSPKGVLDDLKLFKEDRAAYEARSDAELLSRKMLEYKVMARLGVIASGTSLGATDEEITEKIAAIIPEERTVNQALAEAEEAGRTEARGYLNGALRSIRENAGAQLEGMTVGAVYRKSLSPNEDMFYLELRAGLLGSKPLANVILITDKATGGIKKVLIRDVAAAGDRGDAANKIFGAGQPNPANAVYVEMTSDLAEDEETGLLAGSFSNLLMSAVRSQFKRLEGFSDSQSLERLSADTQAANTRLYDLLDWQLLRSPSEAEVRGFLERPGGEIVRAMLERPDSAGLVLSEHLVLVRPLNLIEPAGGVYLPFSRMIFLQSEGASTFGHELYHHIHHNWQSLFRHYKSAGFASEEIPAHCRKAIDDFQKLLAHFNRPHSALESLIKRIFVSRSYRGTAALIEEDRLRCRDAGETGIDLVWKRDAADEPAAYLLDAMIAGTGKTFYRTAVTDSDRALFAEIGFMPPGPPGETAGEGKELDVVFEELQIDPRERKMDFFLGALSDSEQGMQLLQNAINDAMKMILPADNGRVPLDVSGDLIEGGSYIRREFIPIRNRQSELAQINPVFFENNRLLLPLWFRMASRIPFLLPLFAWIVRISFGIRSRLGLIPKLNDEIRDSNLPPKEEPKDESPGSSAGASLGSQMTAEEKAELRRQRREKAARENPELIARIDQIKDEMRRVHEFLLGVENAVTIFGSARILPKDLYGEIEPEYVMAEELGAALYKAGFRVRTGAGPAMMEAPLAGWIKARMEEQKRLKEPESVEFESERGEKVSLVKDPTQGIRIILPFEQATTPFVEAYINVKYYLPRKVGLWEKCLAVVGAPGGFGTMNELFEVWARGIPAILLEYEKEGFWTPIMAAMRETMLRKDADGRYMYIDANEKRLEVLKNTPVTHHPDEVVDFVEAHREWTPEFFDAKELERLNEEIEDGLLEINEWPTSVVVFGKPREDRREVEVLRQIAEASFAEGRDVRLASRGVVLHTVMDEAEKSGNSANVQAVEFSISDEELPEEERLPDRCVISRFGPSHSMLIAEKAEACVFLPGGEGTETKLWAIVNAIQTGEITEKTPIILVGSEFWKPQMDAITRTMLEHEPSLIKPQDVLLFQIVDTAEEALTIIEDGRRFRKMKNEVLRGDKPLDKVERELRALFPEAKIALNGSMFYADRRNVGLNANAFFHEIFVYLRNRPDFSGVKDLLVLDTNFNEPELGKVNVFNPSVPATVLNTAYESLASQEKDELFESLAKRIGTPGVLIHLDHHYDFPALARVSTAVLAVDFLRYLRGKGRTDLIEKIQGALGVMDHADADVMLAHLAVRNAGEPEFLEKYGDLIRDAALLNDHQEMRGDTVHRAQVTIFYDIAVGLQVRVEDPRAGETFMSALEKLRPAADYAMKNGAMNSEEDLYVEVMTGIGVEIPGLSPGTETELDRYFLGGAEDYLRDKPVLDAILKAPEGMAVEGRISIVGDILFVYGSNRLEKRLESASVMRYFQTERPDVIEGLRGIVISSPVMGTPGRTVTIRSLIQPDGQYVNLSGNFWKELQSKGYPNAGGRATAGGLDKAPVAWSESEMLKAAGIIAEAFTNQEKSQDLAEGGMSLGAEGSLMDLTRRKGESDSDLLREIQKAYEKAGPQGVRELLIVRAQENIEVLRKELESKEEVFLAGLLAGEKLSDVSEKVLNAAVAALEGDETFREEFAALFKGLASAEFIDAAMRDFGDAVFGMLLGGAEVEASVEEKAAELSSEAIGDYGKFVDRVRQSLFEKTAAQGKISLIVQYPPGSPDDMKLELQSLADYSAILKTLAILHARGDRLNRADLTGVGFTVVPVPFDPLKADKGIVKARNAIDAENQKAPVTFSDHALKLSGEVNQSLISVMADIRQLPDRLKKPAFDTVLLLLCALALEAQGGDASAYNDKVKLEALLYRYNAGFMAPSFVFEDNGIRLDIDAFIQSISEARAMEEQVKRAA